jgi:type II secretory pathway pseudopilin PulG
MTTHVRYRRQSAVRSGVILLEVLVALVILGTVGAAMASLAAGVGDDVRRAERRDGEIARASALMEAVALWPREDLDRHLGAHHQGPWVLEIQRLTETLYTVELSDSGDTKALLRTAFYRARSRQPELDHAP